MVGLCWVSVFFVCVCFCGFDSFVFVVCVVLVMFGGGFFVVGVAFESSDGFEREGEFSFFGGALVFFVEDFM